MVTQAFVTPLCTGAHMHHLRLLLLLALVVLPATTRGLEVASGSYKTFSGSTLLLHEAEEIDSKTSGSSSSSKHLTSHLGSSFDQNEGLDHERNAYIASVIDDNTPGTNYQMIDGLTNASFATQLCDFLTTSTTVLRLLPAPTYIYRLPECLPTTAPSLVALIAKGLVVDTFANVPSAITHLELGDSFFARNTDVTSSATFFDTNGNFLLAPLIGNFNSLDTLIINNCHFTATLTGVTLPSIYTVFTVKNTKLSGSLPNSLLSSSSSYNSLLLDLSNNQLSGLVPSSFLNVVPWLIPTNGLLVDLSGNQLSGLIPPDLLLFNFNNVFTQFSLNLSHNALSGTIADTFVPKQIVTPNSASSFSLDLSSNGITGSLPPGFLEKLEPKSIIYLDVSNNKLEGTLPPTILPAAYSPYAAASISVAIKLTNNSITGTIPSTFLTDTLPSDARLESLELQLGFNNLTGTIPASLLFDRYGFSISGSVVVGLEHNELNGTFPSKLIPMSSSSASASIFASHNKLSSIDIDLLTAFNSTRNYTLDLSDNLITGTLPPSCFTTTAISLDLSGNRLVGTIPDAWTGCGFTALYLARMSSLNGVIPSQLFTNTPKLDYFYAANASLTGMLPGVPTRSTFNFDLSSTSVALCTDASKAALTPIHGICLLDTTSACMCRDDYTNLACSVENCCRGSAPSAEFTCVSGVWTASTTNGTTLVVPVGVGTVVVTGNLTSDSIILQGIGASVSVAGCAGNLTKIEIELTTSDLESLNPKLLQTLITTGSSCNNLENVQLSANLRSGGCKKLKTQKVVSAQGSTLGAYFTLDKSGCNTWWIILVSVICGVILLALITLVLLAIFYRPFREKIRPYSKKRGPETPQVR